MLDGKEANILIQIASDALEGIQDIGKVGMNGQSDIVAHGISEDLGNAVQGIRRILGEARTERIEKLVLEVGIEHPKDVIPQDGILGLIRDSRVNLTVTRYDQVSNDHLASKGTDGDELILDVSRKNIFPKEGPNGPCSTCAVLVIMVPLRERYVRRHPGCDSAVREGCEVDGDIDQCVTDVFRLHVTDWGVFNQVANWL